ncbi:MAG TPA: hypothetical protein GXX22_03390 [Clostridiales bacterium]|nr:hypothetical protein [Clostridiales bacterium]
MSITWILKSANSRSCCDTWYEIKNNVVTGSTASGKEFSFTYTPSKE